MNLSALVVSPDLNYRFPFAETKHNGKQNLVNLSVLSALVVGPDLNYRFPFVETKHKGKQNLVNLSVLSALVVSPEFNHRQVFYLSFVNRKAYHCFYLMKTMIACRARIDMKQLMLLIVHYL